MSGLERISSPSDIAEFNYVIDAFCVGKKPLLPSSIVRDKAFFDAFQTYCSCQIDQRFFYYIKSEYACYDDAWKNIHGYRNANRDFLLNILFTFADAYYKTNVLRPTWLHAGFKPIR